MTKIEKALIEALPHICRQQKHGKHEQDRSDAVAWIEQYGELVQGLKAQTSTPEYPEVRVGRDAPKRQSPPRSIYIQGTPMPLRVQLWSMSEDGWEVIAEGGAV